MTYVCSKIIIFFRDLREDVTDDLLKAYYERYCEKLACPDEEPTFQELQEDYRISLQIAAIQVNTNLRVFKKIYFSL